MFCYFKIFLIVLCVSPNIAYSINWVPWSDDYEGIPTNAVIGGKNSHGQYLFVIRANTDHGVLPGKYNAEDRQAYIPYGGRESNVYNFEVIQILKTN